MSSNTNTNSMEGRWQITGFSDDWQYNEIILMETPRPGQENDSNISGNFHASVIEGDDLLYKIGGVRFLDRVILAFYENGTAQLIFMGELENSGTISGDLVEISQRNKKRVILSRL